MFALAEEAIPSISARLMCLRPPLVSVVTIWDMARLPTGMPMVRASKDVRPKRGVDPFAPGYRPGGLGEKALAGEIRNRET